MSYILVPILFICAAIKPESTFCFNISAFQQNQINAVVTGEGGMGDPTYRHEFQHHFMKANIYGKTHGKNIYYIDKKCKIIPLTKETYYRPEQFK